MNILESRPGRPRAATASGPREQTLPPTLWLVSACIALALGLAACSDYGAPTDTPDTSTQLACDDQGVVCTVVGNGQRAFTGEGAAPQTAALYYPIDIAFDGQGRLLVLDWNNLRIRRVDADNRLRTIMGDGFDSGAVEGANARESSLHHAFSICFDLAGNLYIAGNHQSQILRVDTAGIVHIVAGRVDASGFAGDGGPAVAAQLDTPQGVAVTPSGSAVYFADTGNNRIRMVDASGTIRTICGDGTSGYAGDGGLATLAKLRQPIRVRYNAGTQSLYICDLQNNAVRRIDAAGIITTVAGTGAPGFAGDGGPATAAKLNLPYDVAFASDGSLYIADTGNNRIRQVAPNGIIKTIAGNGAAAYAGEPAIALLAPFDHPSALAFDAQGNLWVADAFNCRVRRIAR